MSTIATALKDAGKLYVLMVVSGLTTIALFFIITMLAMRLGANEGATLVSKLGTQQDLLQWHQQEAERIKKNLQQK